MIPSQFLCQFSPGLCPELFAFMNTAVNPMLNETDFLLTLPLFPNIAEVLVVIDGIAELKKYNCSTS